MAITKTPDPGRPLWKRMTARGVALLACLQILEAENMIPMGITETLAHYGEVAGSLLVALGVYRHIPTT